MSETKSGIDWLPGTIAPIWTATRLHHDSTIMEMKQTFGMVSILVLFELWCFARKTNKSGKLAKNFVKRFRQHIAHASIDVAEFNAYMSPLDNGWLDWIINHNLLEKTKDGYQIVFGLVYFDNPYDREEVQNQ